MDDSSGKLMKTALRKAFLTYFVIALIFGLYHLFNALFWRSSFKDTYNSQLPFLAYLLLYLNYCLIMYGLVLIYFIIKYRLQIRLITYPIYHILIERTWFILVTYLVVKIYITQDYTSIVNNLSNFDWIFYTVDVLLPAYFIYDILKNTSKK